MREVSDPKEPDRRRPLFTQVRYYLGRDSEAPVDHTLDWLLRWHKGDAQKALRGLGSVAARMRRADQLNGDNWYHRHYNEKTTNLITELRRIRDDQQAGKSWGQDPAARSKQ